MSAILVVDDEPAICLAVERALGKLGHDVTILTDGNAAMKTLSTRSFSLALIDLCMPNVHGLQIIRAARETAPNMPLIVMSGLLSAADGDLPDFFGMSIKLDNCHRLAKPFGSSALRDLVSTIIPTQHAAVSEPAPAQMPHNGAALADIRAPYISWEREPTI